MGETCANCRYWCSYSHTCHRYPPPDRWGWPKVGRSGWCGEHRPSDPPAAAAPSPMKPRPALMAESRRRIVEKAS